MKHLLVYPVIIVPTLLPLNAEVVNFDLSPTGTSPGIGLNPANEIPAATGTGSGGEILSGITYDTDTNLLSLPIGYGSFAGFTNLTGPATAAHIHGPAPVTGTAGPIHDFFATSQHLFAPSQADGGVIIGSATLSEANEADLLNGLLYVNIHTAANANGEIRGQLVEANEAPTINCPEETEIECLSHDDTPVELVASVEDLEGDALVAVWTVDGEAQPEIQLPSGGATTTGDITLAIDLGLGEHIVSLAVSDGVNTATCESTVSIVDNTPPQITSIAADPEVLWPPNGKMKTVNLDVIAEDACGEVFTEIVSITSSDNGPGQFSIVDEDTVQLRAKRAGGTSRTYTITVEASDESGNTATGTVEVTVPRSRGNRNGRR